MLNPTYLRLAFATALILLVNVSGDTQPVSSDRILGPIDAAKTAVVTGQVLNDLYFEDRMAEMRAALLAARKKPPTDFEDL